MLPQINALRRILYILRSSGQALIDEVDLVLSLLQEMNIPIGETKFVKPERIEILRKLFQLFESENAPIEVNKTVNLRDKIGLQYNKQTLLSDADRKGDIAKAVAWKFAKESSLLKLN